MTPINRLTLLESAFFADCTWTVAIKDRAYRGDWYGFLLDLAADEDGATWDATLSMFGKVLSANEPTPEGALREMKKQVQGAIRRFLSTDPELSNPMVAEDIPTVAQAVGRKLYYNLEENKADTDKCLNILFREFEELFQKQKFEVADIVMANLNPFLLGEDLAVGVLTVTLPAAAHLPRRKAFFDRTISTFSEVDLKGLES